MSEPMQRLRVAQDASRARILPLVAILLVAHLIGCSGDESRGTTATGQTDVGISGNSFTLNGAAWTPRAFNLAGFVSTPAYLQTLTSQAKYQGYLADTACTPNLFAAVQRWGADTVRIFVSQYFLNPESASDPYYDPDYFDSVIAIISEAREAGLVVEIAMQDEEEGGGPRFHGLPTQQTLENWLALNQHFGDDQGVMYELYNEPTQGRPNADPTAEDWMLWLNGGQAHYPPGDADAFTAIGMQDIIDELRAAGSVNTVVLDGLALATTLAGVPPVHDPLNRVGYGVHQYLQQGTVGPSDWEAHFGKLSGTLPIFVDEWFACANSKPGLLGLDSYQIAVDFVNYLQAKHIGIGGWAIDVAGYMVNDIPSASTCSAGWQQPSYYAGFPSMPIGDAGVLLINAFRADYGRTLTLGDGMTLYQQPPPAYPAIDCST